MHLTFQGIRNREDWEKADIALPAFDIEAVRGRTREQPSWIHFGAGNIFRAFPAAALQQLLDRGTYDRGVIACETYDPEIIDKAYTPFDNLSLLCVLHAGGQIEKRVVASVTEALTPESDGLMRLNAIFESPSLQMISLTVTEKAYTANNSLMRLLGMFLGARYRRGAQPLAMVSMDNCAHNGDKLRDALLSVARNMLEYEDWDEDFFRYVKEDIAFPISMIDKITPHPDPQIAHDLAAAGVENMDVIRTARGTVTAGFVNAESAAYLVIEDKFPAGRPPLDQAGIIFTDRDTVEKVEKMKVGTCLNPLHTALAVLGCLLGFQKIADEMRDEDLNRFVQRLGYVESLPVVEDPGVISPRAFLDEVLTQRLTNPFLPDTPQRIAADTSQKIPIRFGWTISATRDKQTLYCVPFVLAAWLRYLTGVDDSGNDFTPSPDPRMDEVRKRMAGGLTDALLSDASLFGADLVAVGLAPRVREMFSWMMQGEGAVRRALKRVLGEGETGCA